MSDTENPLNGASQSVDIEIADLLAELNRPVQVPISEKKPTAGPADKDAGDAAAEIPGADKDQGADEKANEDDFTPGEDETGDAPGPDPIIPPKPIQLTYSPEKMAKNIVEGLDGVIELAMPALYKMSLGKEDRQALKQIARKYRVARGNKKQLVLTEQDQEIMDIYLEFEDYCDDLPLDDDEKKSIIDPLAEVLKTMKVQTKPSDALLVAVMLVLFPRVFPVARVYASKMMDKDDDGSDDE